MFNFKMFKVFQFFVAFATFYVQSVPIQDSIAKTHPKVYGNAEPGQFPYHVSLSIAYKNSVSHCSGAILSDNWVLTSAKCLVDGISVTVHAGTLSDREGGIEFLADSYIIHEDYHDLQNDIGLVNLTSTPITFNENITAVALPSSEDVLDAGVEVTVTGWGEYYENRDVSLQYGVEKTISNSDCEAFIVMYDIEDGNICLMGDNSLNKCFADAGSPMVVNAKEKPVVAGTFSFINRWGCKVYPAEFARVSYYRDWIKEKTGL